MESTGYTQEVLAKIFLLRSFLSKVILALYSDFVHAPEWVLIATFVLYALSFICRKKGITFSVREYSVSPPRLLL